jgi:hypothetical protein
MRNKILTLLISLFSIVGYGQITIQDTITINATLLKVNGVEQGMLINTVVLEPAFYYKIVATKTLDWSTITFEELADSLQFENIQMQNQINLLQFQITNLIEQVNASLPRYEFNQLVDKLKVQPVLCEPN